MKLQHVIRNSMSTSSENDKSLFWSNTDGWVDYANATIFTTRERNTLPLPMGGEWMQKS